MKTKQVKGRFYTKPHHYTKAELNDCAIFDLVTDHRCSLEAAKGKHGPVTEEVRDELIAYATKCLEKARAMGYTDDPKETVGSGAEG